MSKKPQNRGQWQSLAEEEKGGCDIFVVIATVAKVIATLLAIAVLVVISPFRPDFNIAIIIGTCVCTFMYVVVSIVVDIVIMCKIPKIGYHCDFVETMVSISLLCCWLISVGIAITVSLSSGATTTEQFGWIGACCGLNLGIFIALAGLYGFRTAVMVLS